MKAVIPLVGPIDGRTNVPAAPLTHARAGPRRAGPPISARSCANLLLAALTSQTRRALEAHLEPVSLHAGSVLYNIGDRLSWTYFPTSGMISLQGMTADGEVLQLAIADRHGFDGAAALLCEDVMPYRAVVLIPGHAFRSPVSTFVAACRRDGALQQLALRAAQAHVAALGQTALCHRFHTTRQRLSGWLLACAHQSDASTVIATQERLAQVLGCPRTTISILTTTLQDAGLVRQRRGRIEVVDRRALAVQACRCAGFVG